jgi:DNA-binding IclR family transcriptional regulator
VSAAELTEPLRRLIERHIPTLDHVTILLAAREQAGAVHSPTALAQHGRLDRSTGDRVVADLVASRLLQRDGQDVRYAPPNELGSLVDELAIVYSRMPVTLIRAIYARVSRVT